MSRHLTRAGQVRLWVQVWDRLTCNWLAIAWHCHRHGHEDGDQYVGLDHVVSVCRYCGRFLGARRIR